MATLLGKRKRRVSLSASSDSSGAGSDGDRRRLRALLQAHYERTYEPLAPHKAAVSSSDVFDDGTASSPSEVSWSGMSDGGGGDAASVQVVENEVEVAEDEAQAKAELRAFMVRARPLRMM